MLAIAYGLTLKSQQRRDL